MLKIKTASRLQGESIMFHRLSSLIRHNMDFPDYGIVNLELPKDIEDSYDSAYEYMQKKYEMKTITIGSKGKIIVNEGISGFLNRVRLLKDDNDSRSYTDKMIEILGKDNSLANPTVLPYLDKYKNPYEDADHESYRFNEVLYFESSDCIVLMPISVSSEPSRMNTSSLREAMSIEVMIYSNSDLGHESYLNGKPNTAFYLGLFNYLAINHYPHKLNDEVVYEETVEFLDKLYEAWMKDMFNSISNLLDVSESDMIRSVLSNKLKFNYRYSDSKIFIDEVQAADIYLGVNISSVGLNEEEQHENYIDIVLSQNSSSNYLDILENLICYRSDKVNKRAQEIVDEEELDTNGGLVLISRDIEEFLEVKVINPVEGRLICYFVIGDGKVIYGIGRDKFFNFFEFGDKEWFVDDQSFKNRFLLKNKFIFMSNNMTIFTNLEDSVYKSYSSINIEIPVKQNNFIKFSSTEEAIKFVYEIMYHLNMSEDIIKKYTYLAIREFSYKNGSKIGLIQGLFKEAIRKYSYGGGYSSENLSFTDYLYEESGIDLEGRRGYCRFDDLEGDQVIVYHMALDSILTAYRNGLSKGLPLEKIGKNYRLGVGTSGIEMTKEELSAEIFMREEIAYRVAKISNSKLFGFSLNSLDSKSLGSDIISMPQRLNKKKVADKIDRAMEGESLLKYRDNYGIKNEKDLILKYDVDEFVNDLDLEFLQ